MYQLLLILIVVTFLSGCESLQRDRFLEASNALWGRAGAAFKGIGQQESEPVTAIRNDFTSELDPLLEQPYIDPLTRYLKRYNNDDSRADVVPKVRQERDRRCSVIADQYAAKPLSREALNLYRVGYLLSCPQDVNAYAQRLDNVQNDKSKKREMRTAEPGGASDETDTSAKSSSVSTSDDTTTGDVIAPPPSQQLSDCYLLTAIRNFSGALKACLEPAEAGNVQAQTNMAVIAHSLRDYETAHNWALRASSESGEASYLLGQMYRTGNGVSPNRDEATKWYTNAAEQGHAEAQAALEEDPDKSSEGQAAN